MPAKNLTSPLDRNGNQKLFKFGGGANTIFTANGYFVDPADPESFVSYTTGYNINTGGGNDIIYGSDIAAGDTLTGGDGDDIIFGGGGGDTIRGGNLDGSDASKGQSDAPTNILVGDGERVEDDSTVFSAYTADVDFRDLLATFTRFDGGNDTITGGDGATLNSIYGDAANVDMDTDSVFNGGWDVLRGGNDSLTNSLYGDAQQLNMVVGSDFIGGSDYVRGGNSTDPNGVNVVNNLHGDVQSITSSVGSFDGGDDKLVGGSGTGVQIVNGNPFFDVRNEMTGDTGSVGGLGADFQGGNDTLISGAFAVDNMTGDWASGATGGEVGGEDTFVFGLNNGTDTITDFRSSDDDGIGAIGDTINLAATGLVSCLSG